MSERNRLDTLQIVRIQQNLSSVAGALRDMLGGTEPYPLAAWANTFTRLRIDLEQALARERELAPAGRLTAEQARLDEANGRFWEAVERAFATANANGGGPAAESAAARDHPRRSQRAPCRAGHPRVAARHPQHAHGRSVGGARPRRLRPGRPPDLSAGRGPRGRRRDRRRHPAPQHAADLRHGARPGGRAPGAVVAHADACRRRCRPSSRASCTTSSARSSPPSA